MTDINNKNLYIGGSSYNSLIIITFTWTGLGGDVKWTNSNNWTGAVGYPSASTEIAIITTTSGTQPTINSVDNISVYQLTVGNGMTLTMQPSSVINVFDTLTFSGTAAFDPASTFGYSSSNNAQNIINLNYGNLAITGTGAKNLGL